MTQDPFAEHSARFLKAFDFTSEIEDKEREHQNQLREILISLVEVVDSFDRFFAFVSDKSDARSEKTQSWLNTLRLISAQVEKILTKSGLEQTTRVGQPVDPEKHEVVDVQETHDIESDTIIEILKRGYQWNDEPFRYSQVVVARRISEEDWQE